MIFIFIAAAYLLGTIPFGLFIGYWVKGIDVRTKGSGNLGATNVFRVVGKKWGILVFFLDALKGFVAVMLPVYLQVLPEHSAELILLGVIAILGHTFPVWLRFKGGKGVATSLGVFIAIVPQASLLTFAGWTVVFLITRILSFASLGAAILFPILVFISCRETPIFSVIFPVSILLTFFIFYTHQANIRRLLKGEEKRLF